MGDSRSWAKELIEYYKQGYSDAEVAAAMNITIREFNTTLSENPTFAKLVEFGRTLSTAFWEGLARKNISNKTFNTPLYNFYMKNKYGWADKIDTTNINDNTNNLTLDQLRTEINRKIKKLVADNTLELSDAQRVLQPVENKQELESD